MFISTMYIWVSKRDYSSQITNFPNEEHNSEFRYIQNTIQNFNKVPPFLHSFRILKTQRIAKTTHFEQKTQIYNVLRKPKLFMFIFISL
jgi:hypothetical protein